LSGLQDFPAFFFFYPGQTQSASWRISFSIFLIFSSRFSIILCKIREGDLNPRPGPAPLSWRRDLNSRPDAYEAPALATELLQPERAGFALPLSYPGAFERVSGVEPPSIPWEGIIITAILHPHFVTLFLGVNYSIMPLTSAKNFSQIFLGAVSDSLAACSFFITTAVSPGFLYPCSLIFASQ
jgi:hypothetical protein